jgi:hypothetical protein
VIVQPHLYQNIESNAAQRRRPHDNPEMAPFRRSHL